ncbi:two-component response regulator ARR2-like [Carica papaya]|uniref:two-component response regulator ARR2-like n=1 Tax=Carica papaya TaxID=3649 RepID=UPI000B8CFD08|nr:two-component response regulator ARR2-like [Carica papaya]
MGSETEMDTTLKALQDGVCFCLEKPISPQNVRDVWQHGIKKNRSNEIGSIKEGENGNGVGENQAKVNPQSIPVSNRKEPNVVPGNRQSKVRKTRSAFDNTSVNAAWEDGEEDKGGNCAKKQRMVWNHDLELEFTAVVSALSDKETRLKSTLSFMNVPESTQPQVTSHKQIGDSLNNLQNNASRVQVGSSHEVGSSLNNVQNNASRVQVGSSYGLQNNNMLLQPGSSLNWLQNNLPMFHPRPSFNFQNNNAALQCESSLDVQDDEVSSIYRPQPEGMQETFLVLQQGSSSSSHGLWKNISNLQPGIPSDSYLPPPTNQSQNQGVTDYQSLQNFLDNEEAETTGNGNDPKPEEVEQLYQWLAKVLAGDEE